MSEEIFYITLKDEVPMKVSRSVRNVDEDEKSRDRPPESYEQLGLEAFYPSRDDESHVIDARVDARAQEAEMSAMDETEIRKAMINYKKSKSKLARIKLPAKPKPKAENYSLRYSSYVLRHIGSEPNVVFMTSYYMKNGMKTKTESEEDRNVPDHRTLTNSDMNRVNTKDVDNQAVFKLV